MMPENWVGPPAAARLRRRHRVPAMEMTVQTQSAKRGRVDPHLSMRDHDPDADLMLLHFGPQHPSTHGVFRMDLYLDGEIVVKAVPYVGYLHRGVEKLCEKLTYVQLTPIVDKNDYVAPMTNEQALNMAFEKLLGVEVPRRARYLRSIFAEMQRIASHLLWLGTFALDLGGALGGGSTLFIHCVPRARADPRPLRGRHRRALPLQHAHDRRQSPRPARGLGREGEVGARDHLGAHPRVRGDDARTTRSSSIARRAWACSTASSRWSSGSPARCCAPRASTTTCGATRPTTPTTRSR